MERYTATVKEEFGEHLVGEKLDLAKSTDYEGYYWILDEDGKQTTKLVSPTLLLSLKKVNQAA